MSAKYSLRYMEIISVFLCTLVLITCNPKGSADRTELCDQPCCTEFDSTDELHYHLCSPNGKEVLFVGDTVLIKVCSEDTTLFRLDDMEKQLSVDKGETWIVFYTNDDLDEKSNEKHWIVPARLEYLDTNGVKIVSAVSENALLRVVAYGEASDKTVDFDRSDGYFAIRNKNP